MGKFTALASRLPARYLTPVPILPRDPPKPPSALGQRLVRGFGWAVWWIDVFVRVVGWSFIAWMVWRLTLA